MGSNYCTFAFLLCVLTCSAALQLPFDSLFPNPPVKNVSPWYVTKVGFGSENMQFGPIDGVNVLKVKYPQYSYSYGGGPTGGCSFYAWNTTLSSSNTLELKYKVRFNSNFLFVKGGKLPGFYIGDGASGGSYSPTGGSYRVMWRKDGAGEAYVYPPEGITLNFGTTPVVLDSTYGISVWRTSGLKFQTAPVWNTVIIRMKLNTVDSTGVKQNGLLYIDINNNPKTFNGMVWRKYNSVSNVGIMFSTFFGGSDSSWATPATTYAYFKDVEINKY